MSSDRYENTIDTSHSNLELAWRSRLGDTYDQEYEAGSDVNEGETAKSIPPHTHSTQVAYASVNIDYLYGDSKSDGGTSVAIAKGGQVAVPMLCDGCAKIRYGAHTGWADSSLLQSAAPANTMS